MDRGLLKRQYPMTKGYFSHGFVPKKQSGMELLGECLFCGSEKFSMNINKGTWKCWTGCGGGSYYTFLKKIAEYYRLEEDSPSLLTLAEHKHIPVNVLYEFKLAYNPKTDEYLIPEVLDSKITDLKRYKFWEENGNIEKYFYSSPNTKKSYYANDRLDSENIIICEGEWDFFILHHLFINSGVVCLPGVSTFKEEWSHLFRNKNVIVIFDNDRPRFHQGKFVIGAADQGSIKVFNHLKYLVSNIAFLKWEKTLKNGYDVRDLWVDTNENIENTTEYILNNLMSKPNHYDEQRHSKGNEVTYKTLYNTIDKWIDLDDKTMVDAVYATIYANKIDTDPLWLMLVARSGFSKTTIIETLRGSNNTYHTSSITPASLAYGGRLKEGEEDKSLIKRLNKKILIIKDLTTMLNNDPLAVANVFGILRDAYDGNTQRDTAHNIASFKSSFGIICGVTPVIYDHLDGNTKYGERFLFYRAKDDLGMFQELNVIKSAIGNTNKESKMVSELQNIGKILAERSISTIPTITPEYENKIAYLSMWLSIMRAAITRNKYRNNEVMGKAMMEIGTRIGKQLKAYLLGLCMFKGRMEATEEDFISTRDIAISSAPEKLMPIFKYLIKSGVGKEFLHSELLENTTYSERPGEFIIEDLVIIKVLQPTNKSMVKGNTTYRMTNKMKLISKVIF